MFFPCSVGLGEEGKFPVFFSGTGHEFIGWLLGLFVFEEWKLRAAGGGVRGSGVGRTFEFRQFLGRERVWMVAGDPFVARVECIPQKTGIRRNDVRPLQFCLERVGFSRSLTIGTCGDPVQTAGRGGLSWFRSSPIGPQGDRNGAESRPVAMGKGSQGTKAEACIQKLICTHLQPIRG